MNNISKPCVYIINDDNDIEISKFIMSINSLLKFHIVNKVYIYYDMDDHKILEYTDQLNFYDHNENTEIICNRLDMSLIYKYFNSSNYNLYSLFISTFINEEDYIYISNNILFNDDISDVFNSIQDNTLLFGFNSKIYLNEPNDFGNYFFNENTLDSEILYINVNLYNKNNILNDVIEYYNQNYQNIENISLSCYNYIFIKYSSLCVLKYSSNYNRGISNPKNLVYEWPYIKLFNFNNKNHIFMNTIYDLVIKK